MTTALTTFDYAVLDAETRIVVQQRTGEIKEQIETVRRSTSAIGARLIEVKARLPHGQWGVWLRAEFQWSQDTAEHLMQVARLSDQNPKFSEFEDRFARTALTALAAPSAPDAARDEALTRAEQGETITYKAAQQIIEQHKPPTPANEARAEPTDDQVAEMRRRFYALGYEQFYRSDAGWTAYHPKTKKANYKTWADVEADIRRKEAMAQPRICATCGGPWGAPGSMVTSEGMLCQDCAAKRLSSGRPFAPAASAAPTIALSTDTGPHQVQPMRWSDQLLLHPSVGAHADTYPYSISHRPTGRLVARYAAQEVAERAFQELDALDWGLVRNDGGAPQTLVETIRTVLARYAASSDRGDIPVVRRCGRCKQPSDSLTSYGPGLFPGYPNGVVVCHRCVVEVLREQSTREEAERKDAPAVCEDCGREATNKRTIGGMLAHRCDACAARATEQEEGDRAAATARQADGPLAHFTAICDRAVELGATVNPTAYNDPRFVQVVPPKGYQQAPLRCDAADLARLITAWEGQQAPPPPSDWAWPWEADAALSRLHAARKDQAAAIRAAAALIMALAGDAAQLALTQAEHAARILEAEGYASIASFLRLLVPPDDGAAAAPDLTITAAAGDIAENSEVTR